MKYNYVVLFLRQIYYASKQSYFSYRLPLYNFNVKLLKPLQMSEAFDAPSGRIGGSHLQSILPLFYCSVCNPSHFCNFKKYISKKQIFKPLITIIIRHWMSK